MSTRAKVVGLTALLLLSGVGLAIRGAFTAQRRQVEQEKIAKLEEKLKQGRISIPEAIELVKAKGEKRVVVPSLSTLYMGLAGVPEELDEKLPTYTVVVAQLVGQKSYMVDEAVIRTWNKFKVIEELSIAPPRPTYFSWPSPPEELLPIKEGEFLTHSEGGTVTVGEVEVIQADADVAPFKKNSRYLLVLSLDPSTRIGWLELGPQALIPLGPGNTLYAGQENNLLQQVIKGRYDGSLSHLRASLRSRANSR